MGKGDNANQRVERSTVVAPDREFLPGKRVETIQEGIPINLAVPEIKVQGGRLNLEVSLLNVPDTGHVAQIAFRGKSGRMKWIKLDEDPHICESQYNEIKGALQRGEYRVEVTPYGFVDITPITSMAL